MASYGVLPGRFTYPLPIKLDAYGAWPGLSENERITGCEVDVVVTRSPVTITAACLSVVLTRILSVSVVGTVVSVLFSRRAGVRLKLRARRADP